MKAVILAGGFGSRLSEETVLKPKPMVEIGGKPILWHILNIYSAHGVNEFVIALGYKGDYIKEYFLNYYAFNSDVTVDLMTGTPTFLNSDQQPWKVHLVNTGLYTQTGGRLLRLKDWLKDDDCFCFTYGDGVSNIDIQASIDFHRSHGKHATMTSVHTPERFGRIGFEQDNRVSEFYEKPAEAEGWINGGFFVLSPKVFDYIDNDTTIWERDPVERLAREGQLMGYQHRGFWSCMDTLKEKQYLESLWQAEAPWKVW
ncbi:MAG: glucose-1-phosphate cytidylyltransferase [Bacteroidota bacterium]